MRRKVAGETGAERRNLQIAGTGRLFTQNHRETKPKTTFPVQFPLILDESFVFVMSADPEPVEALPFAECERTEGLGDSNRPEISDRLQVEGWVGRVLAEQGELFVRLSPNVGREATVGLPKLAGGV
jgi:hypothetical protein